MLNAQICLVSGFPVFVMSAILEFDMAVYKLETCNYRNLMNLYCHAMNVALSPPARSAVAAVRFKASHQEV